MGEDDRRPLDGRRTLCLSSKTIPELHPKLHRPAGLVAVVVGDLDLDSSKGNRARTSDEERAPILSMKGKRIEDRRSAVDNVEDGSRQFFFCVTTRKDIEAVQDAIGVGMLK